MKYWSNREINQQIKLYDKSLDAFELELASQYSNTLKGLERDITALYEEIMNSAENGTVLVSDLYKYNKYYELIDNINKELTRLGKKEIPIYDKRLTDFYNKNSKLVGSSFGLTSIPNQRAVENAVKAVWCGDGMNYSSRIWKNKELLAERLEQGLVDAMARGATKDELTRQIIDDFGVSYNNADRIARTELAHVMNVSTVDRYKQAGVKYYQFMAVLDDKTCDECMELNGKIFPIDDTEHLPPIHPNSRSTIIPVLEV